MNMSAKTIHTTRINNACGQIGSCGQIGGSEGGHAGARHLSSTLDDLTLQEFKPLLEICHDLAAKCFKDFCQSVTAILLDII